MIDISGEIYLEVILLQNPISKSGFQLSRNVQVHSQELFENILCCLAFQEIFNVGDICGLNVLALHKCCSYSKM